MADNKNSSKDVTQDTKPQEVKPQENKDNNNINSFRLLDIPKEEMIKVVNSRLGPFLVNQNFLDMDYIVKNPYHNDLVEPTQNLNIKRTSKIKNYYDENTEKFKNNTYDFAIDEYLEKNNNISEISEFTTKDSIYNLAKVLIFVPEK